ncbi:unnamed protein product [Lampetra planeri]
MGAPLTAAWQLLPPPLGGTAETPRLPESLARRRERGDVDAQTHPSINTSHHHLPPPHHPPTAPTTRFEESSPFVRTNCALLLAEPSGE